jgi:hypothetical protein
VADVFTTPAHRARTDPGTHWRGPQAGYAAGVEFVRKRKLSEYQRVEAFRRRDPGETLAPIAKGYWIAISMISAYQAGLAGPGQLPSSISRATGLKWITAAIAIAANQASVISHPGNQPTMTSPNAPRGSNAGAHPSALHIDYYATIGLGGNNKTAFREGMLPKVAIGRGGLFA